MVPYQKSSAESLIGIGNRIEVTSAIEIRCWECVIAMFTDPLASFSYP
jgi:hypothetical protein